MKPLKFPHKFTITWVVSIITITLMTVLPNTFSNSNQENEHEHSDLLHRETTTLFIDLPDLLIVQVDFFSESSPIIESIERLDRGRLTPSVVGEAKLKICDERDLILYQATINPIFVFGEPPIFHEKISKIIILPNIAEAYKIVISYKNWEVEKLIDEN